MIGPVVVGWGTPIFDGKPPVALRLVGTRIWDGSGTVLVRYEVSERGLEAGLRAAKSVSRCHTRGRWGLIWRELRPPARDATRALVGQSHPRRRAVALDRGRGLHSGDLASSLGSTRLVPGPPLAGFLHYRETRRLARRLRRATDNCQRLLQRC